MTDLEFVQNIINHVSNVDYLLTSDDAYKIRAVLVTVINRLISERVSKMPFNAKIVVFDTYSSDSIVKGKYQDSNLILGWSYIIGNDAQPCCFTADNIIEVRGSFEHRLSVDDIANTQKQLSKIAIEVFSMVGKEVQND